MTQMLLWNKKKKSSRLIFRLFGISYFLTFAPFQNAYFHLHMHVFTHSCVSILIFELFPYFINVIVCVCM